MASSTFNSPWLSALQARAQQAPRRLRLPLMLDGHVIGSVESDSLGRILESPGAPWSGGLKRVRSLAGDAWHITGEGTAVLGNLALALRAAQVGRVRQQWRDEQLAVFNKTGAKLATVERGIVRLLGIATQAVHLVGYSPDGRIWVQQRAMDKANDPGQWDTLMGGMVSAGDSLLSALERETMEETGLALSQLQQLRWQACFGLRRPDLPHDDGGYVVEQVDWYACVVPHQIKPLNQDGEVAEFALLDADELRYRLQNNEFTLEAALILVQALEHVRGRWASPFGP